MKKFTSIAMAIGLTTIALGACSQQPGSNSGGVNTSESQKCPPGSQTAQNPTPGAAGGKTYAPPSSAPGTPGTPGSSGATGNQTC